MNKITQLVKVWVSGNRLRTWADQLDQKFAQSHIGDDVPYIIVEGDGFELRLIVDQEEQSREQRKRGG